MREYFSHDYNARNDQKTVQLVMKYGLEGLGIYWCLVEILYECNGYIKEDQISTIAYELRTECERIESILNTDLFSKKGKKFYSDSVLKRLEIRKEKSDKARQSALSRWNPKDKPDANALPTDSESNAIKLKKKKVKESKYKYIDKILNEFVEAYSITGNDYEILNKGKERAAIGKLLKLYKEKYPDKTSDETKIGLRVYFDAVVQISDNWLSQNMSPSIIISKFNEINKILKDGTNKGRGTSDKQLAEILVKHLGEDA